MICSTNRKMSSCNASHRMSVRLFSCRFHIWPLVPPSAICMKAFTDPHKYNNSDVLPEKQFVLLDGIFALKELVVINGMFWYIFDGLFWYTFVITGVM